MSSRKNKKQNISHIINKEKTSTSWIWTYSDMITLLLCFFVLMFTTATLDGRHLKMVVSSFNGAVAPLKGGIALDSDSVASSGFVFDSLSNTIESNNVFSRINKLVINIRAKENSRHRDSKRLKFVYDSRGFVISVPGNVYFESGDAKIRKESMYILDDILYFILDLKEKYHINKQVGIEGHASIERVDNKSYGYSTIWKKNLDLSIQRAVNIHKYFLDRIEYLDIELLPYIELVDKTKMSRFVSKGYGEFQPLYNNNYPSSRAWNRRIDIVIKI